MTTFRTTIQIPKFEFEIDYNSQIMLIGSCFSDNIAHKLTHHLFPTVANPFGVVYNPISIIHSLDRMLKNRLFTPKEVFRQDEIYNCFDVHSQFSSLNEKELLIKLNTVVGEQHKQLKRTNLLIITFGSAWVYHRKDTDEIVANCHKKEASFFTRKRLKVAEIVALYATFVRNLQKINSNIKILFTVSPVRHWKDGTVENQLSKSILHLAIQEILQQHTNTYYFPSYEIMMDDLRDYRFYNSDLIHPNEVAIDYIWEQFKKSCIAESNYPLMEEIHKLRQAAAHKPFHQNTLAHQNFLKKQLLKIEKLSVQHKHINFDEIKNTFLR